MGDLQALAEDLNEHLISMKDYQEEKIEILIRGSAISRHIHAFNFLHCTDLCANCKTYSLLLSYSSNISGSDRSTQDLVHCIMGDTPLAQYTLL